MVEMNAIEVMNSKRRRQHNNNLQISFAQFLLESSPSEEKEREAFQLR